VRAEASRSNGRWRRRRRKRGRKRQRQTRQVGKIGLTDEVAEPRVVSSGRQTTPGAISPAEVRQEGKINPKDADAGVRNAGKRRRTTLTPGRTPSTKAGGETWLLYLFSGRDDRPDGFDKKAAERNAKAVVMDTEINKQKHDIADDAVYGTLWQQVIGGAFDGALMSPPLWDVLRSPMSTTW
jgi:hypothetical protein